MSLRMSKKISICICVLVLVFFIHCSKSQWKGKIYKEQGATVIESYGAGIWGERIEEKISFDTELSLGKVSGEDYLMFNNYLDIAVDSDLNIYVLDSGNHRFMKFDEEGNHIWTAGRKGQGPGELQMPEKIRISPHQEVCVLDGSLRVHVYSLQGEYKHSIMLERSVEDLQFIDPDQLFVQTRIPHYTGLAAAICSNEFEMMEDFPVDYPYGPKISGGGDIGGDIKYLYNSIYMVLPDKYEIRKYDLNGKLLRKIKRDFKFEPPKVTRMKGGGFGIETRNRLGPCFLDQKRGFIINHVMRILGEKAPDFEIVFYLDFFNDEGKFLGSFKLPGMRRLILIDSEGKYYFSDFDPFPSVIRASLKID